MDRTPCKVEIEETTEMSHSSLLQVLPWCGDLEVLNFGNLENHFCLCKEESTKTEANAKPREDDDEPEEGEIVGNQDSASSKPSKGIAPQSHALEHSWTFWFNSPTAKSAKSKHEDWGSSIGPIYTFITVEEFWRTLAGRRKKPRTHRRALREEEEAGLSKSHGLGSASLRTFKEASSPHESPLVPLNLVPSPIKHGTVVQSSPVPPKDVKQTPPQSGRTSSLLPARIPQIGSLR
ncbi:hypothetical protein ACFXTO_022751 [Malus domestica]